MESRLQFDIAAQPDLTTCGPTCLHAVYQYFGDNVPLAQLAAETPRLDEGGTLAVLLGCRLLLRPALAVAGQVERGVGAVGAAEGLAGGAHECTVKKRSLTSRA